MHELLIRIMADLHVSSGERYEELGINFRHMAGTIMSDYIEPHMDQIREEYHDLQQRIQKKVMLELENSMFPPRSRSPMPRKKLFTLRKCKPEPSAVPAESDEVKERRVLAEWRAKAVNASDPVEKDIYQCLEQNYQSMMIRFGQFTGGMDRLAQITTDNVVNKHGSQRIGAMIEPYIKQAVEAEGYRYLPIQAEPVIMVTKGASASGKSSLRPLQHKLFDELGNKWEDVSLITPDIWRKFLLDYNSLGPAKRYAGVLTSSELEVIDKKLDQYMAQKAARRELPHMLIDRFRHDSFDPIVRKNVGSDDYTNKGHDLYLFFMVTAPHETVERAWNRGEEVGRYKAREDVLAHNVEAYTGIPNIFFKWAAKTDQKVHYEFLDNNVPKGTRPKTIAFGMNGEINILDINGMLNIERYKHINISAKNPADLYPPDDKMRPEANTVFLKNIVQNLHRVNFADPQDKLVYLSIKEGVVHVLDKERFQKKLEDPNTKAVFDVIVPAEKRLSHTDKLAEERVSDGKNTIGQWGAQI